MSWNITAPVFLITIEKFVDWETRQHQTSTIIYPNRLIYSLGQSTVCANLPSQGETNNLVVYLYHPDSIFGQAQELDSDCEEIPHGIRDYLICSPRGGGRPRPSSDSDDDADFNPRPAQRQRVCPAGDANYYDAYNTCCQLNPGTSWVELASSRPPKASCLARI